MHETQPPVLPVAFLLQDIDNVRAILKRMRVLLAGHMPRDDAMAMHLAPECQLFVTGDFINPGLIEKAHTSGGEYFLAPNGITDVAWLAKLAVAAEVDMFITNSDDALAAGAVDAVHEANPSLLTPCPTQEQSRIEWDKFMLRGILDEIDPSLNPWYRTASDAETAARAIRQLQMQGMEAVVKPRNLAGGKGVKVQGMPGYETHEDLIRYAEKVWKDPAQTGMEINEKLEGVEFTIVASGDGKTLIIPPTTFDYPYREDGDKGQGTGGMGSFTMGKDRLLPFLDQLTYDKAVWVMQEINRRGYGYPGAMYGNFMVTKNGLKMIEMNARDADPEKMNLYEVMDPSVNLLDSLVQAAQATLQRDSLRYTEQASTVTYLVPPEYGRDLPPQIHEFEMDPEQITAAGCRVYFGSCEKIGTNVYRTLGTSRSLAVASTGATPWQAKANIDTALVNGLAGTLEHRNDVGDKNYIDSLYRRLG